MRNVLNTFSRPLLGSNSVALDATTVGRFAPPCFDSLSPSAMELTTDLVALRTTRTHSKTRGAFIPIMPSPSTLSLSHRPGTSTKSQFRPLVHKCGWWSGRIQRSRVYYLSSKSRSIAGKRHDTTRLVESSSESHCLICSH